MPYPREMTRQRTLAIVFLIALTIKVIVTSMKDLLPLILKEKYSMNIKKHSNIEMPRIAVIKEWIEIKFSLRRYIK